MRQKNFRPKKLRIFFHETTKTPREVFGSHRGESLSSLLVKVAITPPLPSQQAITCSAMPQRGSRAAAIARQRRLWRWQFGGNVQLGSAAVASSLAARRWRQAWQRGCALLHHCCIIAASLGHGRASRHQRRAATARCCGGDEDTGSNSDGGGTNNQQSTKNTETAAMTATTITMETKGAAVAEEARGQRPAWC